MAATKLRLQTSKILRNHQFSNTYSVVQKLLYCTTNSKNEEAPRAVEKLGFAKFNEEKEKFLRPNAEKELKETFASLLRQSKFIDLGDPEGKEVIGTIFHVVEDDLYIDFGWKFHTVCKRPKINEAMYVKGAKVRLVIKELELASTFLGSDREITLLEADCLLLGPLKKVYNKRTSVSNEAYFIRDLENLKEEEKIGTSTG